MLFVASGRAAPPPAAPVAPVRLGGRRTQNGRPRRRWWRLLLALGCCYCCYSLSCLGAGSSRAALRTLLAPALAFSNAAVASSRRLPTGAAGHRGCAARRSGAGALAMAAEPVDVDCLVIGGGVSGMTTAYYTAKGGARTLLAEGAPRLGGVIETRSKDGFLWEDGPNTFQASSKAMLRLASDLNMDLVAADPKLPRFIFSNGRLFALPQELLSLISPLGLIRAAAGAALLPVSVSSDSDETISSFVERSLGEEILDKLVDPFIGTIYNGDPARLSLSSVFPALGKVAAQAAGKPGGLVACAVASYFAEGSDDIGQEYGTLPEAPKGASLSFKNGLDSLPKAVEKALGDCCCTGWKAQSIAEVREENGTYFDVNFDTPNGTQSVLAKVVVVATPATSAAALLTTLAPSASNLEAIQAPPVVAVTLAYPQDAFAQSKALDEASGDLRGFGVLIPRSEGLDTLGFQFISSLFPSRSPSGEQVVLAYYAGSRNSTELTSMTDEEIVGRVHADLKQVLSEPGALEPLTLSVRRWSKGIPQYEVGHQDMIDEIRAELPQGLLLTGAFAGGGVSLGDCAETGFACAEQALELARYQKAMAASAARRAQISHV
eukprot:TRINITY_DN39047_c0_g1_i1.p1 TRINITY_DN39047_c0_g1~~TRINITY_DN39047_c0_g1_i1.p1  ORF type:complete len:606 (-),score=94.09 TRINITY_DN39047_c0_g1_i1:46-1863(-)